MTSQSPASDTNPTEEYKNAWASIQYLVRYEGASWSGRESNRTFLNIGNNQFADASSCTDSAFTQDGRAVAELDWNSDGFPDVLLRSRNAPRIRLLMSNGPQREWLQVSLEGTTSNRDAIGARVRIQLSEGRNLTKSIYAGDSYLAQSSKQLSFAWDANQGAVESVSIRWPSGETESFDGLSSNGRYFCKQGSGVAVAQPNHPQPALAEAPRGLGDELDPGVSRTVLMEALPMAPIVIPSFENKGRSIADLRGKPVLLNLWGTTCANCLKEFGAFQRKEKKIRNSGLRIITLCTDGSDKHDAAKKVLAQFGLENDAGYVTDAFLNSLEIILGEVIGRYNGTPLPTSLLLDALGNLRVVYQGPVRVGKVLRDVRVMKSIQPTDPSGSSIAFGRRLTRRLRDFDGMAQLFQQIGATGLAEYYKSFGEQLRSSIPKAQQERMREEKKPSHLLGG